MRHIDTAAYQAVAAELNTEELRLRKLFDQWLPNDLIDCHSHCNLPEHVLEVPDQAFGHMLSTFPSFSLDDSQRFHRLLHPGKRVRALRFANAFRGIDHRRANEYLLNESDPLDRMALYGLPDDPVYTIEQLQTARPAALKMYYSYSTPPATHVYQYFPPKVLAVAEKYGTPIILHPPIVITKCLDQVEQLLKDFPRLRVVLAHLGLAYTVTPGLREAYERLAEHEYLYADTSLIPSAEVIALAIEVFGVQRIMHGSDQPLNLIRSKVYANPTLGLRLITDYCYHWVNPDEHAAYRHLATDLTHNHWSTLLAIKAAIEALPQEEQEAAKVNIFCGNAEKLFGF